MAAPFVKQPAHRGRKPEMEEEEEDVIPDVVPTSNMKNCPMHL
jgi:hypothetical protein